MKGYICDMYTCVSACVEFLVCEGGCDDPVSNIKNKIPKEFKMKSQKIISDFQIYFQHTNLFHHLKHMVIFYGPENIIVLN